MRRNTESGMALVFVALGMTVLLGAVGFGVDMGYLRYEKRLQQGAADSAALAGASETPFGSGWTAAARSDSASNGFTDGVNNVTVTVNKPPASGAYNGNSAYVEVIVSAVHPTFFMKIMGINTRTVAARAVGGLGGAKGCVYALSTASNAVVVNGSVNLSAPNCGVVDNGGLTVNGSDTITAESIGVGGTYTKNGSVTVTPTPVTGIIPAADPLASLTPPTTATGGCTTLTVTTSRTIAAGNYCGVSINGSVNVVFSGGNYTFGNGGLSINGSNTITFDAGQYMMTSGNLTTNGSNTINGSGDMFYTTGGASVSFNGSSTVNLSAPTSGTYEGILFYQDRSDSAGATVNGSNGSKYTGAMYFPAATLTTNGSNTASATATVLVANKIVFNGSGSFGDDFSAFGSKVSPLKDAVLVE